MSIAGRPQRLREGSGGVARLLDAAARTQEQVTPGARERIFARLSSPRPGLRRWPLVFAAGLAAAAVSLLVFPRRQPRLIERDGVRIALAPNAELREEPLQLVHGAAAFAGTFNLEAGALRIDATDALLVARVRERTELYVRRGTVRAGSVLIPEGGRFPPDAPLPDALLDSLAGMLPPRAVAQVHAPPIDLRESAREAERTGRYAEAAAVYAQLAEGDGTWAGNALYELARLRLRKLDQPALALQTLLEYQRRFPSGPLQQEVALTAIDARVALGQEANALRDIDAFLARYSHSERAAEVRALRANLMTHRLSEPP